MRLFAAENDVRHFDPRASNADAIRFCHRFGFVFVEALDFGDDHSHVHRLSRADHVRWHDADAAVG